MLPENNLFRNRLMTNAETKYTITCLNNIHGNILKIVKDGYGSCRDKMYPSIQQLCRKLNRLYCSSGVRSDKIINYKEKLCKELGESSKLLIESINVAIAKALFIEATENIISTNVFRNAISDYLGSSSKTSSLSCLYLGLFQLHSRNYSYVVTLIEGIFFKYD
jgi:hypothetical protein